MPKRTWTDDQLRALVASSKTWTQVLRGLDLSIKGRNHYFVKRRARELELDSSHFGTLRRTWTDEELRAVLPRARGYEQVLTQLGLDQDRGTRQKVRARVHILGLDTTHFEQPRPPKRRRARRWTDEQLREAVASSFTYASAIAKLGLIPAGGNYDHIRRRIDELQLDTSHFRGSAWNVGRKFNPCPMVPLEEVLVANRWTSTHSLKQRLINAGLKEARCEICGWSERAPDGRIPVELDHMNGDKSDNRIENIRILCPNCHALQPTHRGLNQKRRRK